MIRSFYQSLTRANHARPREKEKDLGQDVFDTKLNPERTVVPRSSMTLRCSLKNTAQFNFEVIVLSGEKLREIGIVLGRLVAGDDDQMPL